MKDVTVNMRVTRRKRRAKRDIDALWHERYNAFIEAGFSINEARWGANEGLSLREPKILDLMDHRRDLVKYFMAKHPTWAKSTAIRAAAQDLQNKLIKYGSRRYNIFYEVSP